MTTDGAARIPVVWDMETGDPDDFLTLLLLLDHPRVDVRAVTVTPGTPAQIGVVRRGLELLDRNLPVGAGDLTYREPPGAEAPVSAWHYQTFGDIPPSTQPQPAAAVLLDTVDETTTLLTGGPNHNLGAALRQAARTGRDWRIGASVAPGGFPREGVGLPDP